MIPQKIVFHLRRFFNKNIFLKEINKSRPSITKFSKPFAEMFVPFCLNQFKMFSILKYFLCMEQVEMQTKLFF